MLKPSNFIYVPIKNGYWLRDSQGKPRMYKSASAAKQNLKNQNYDFIHIYVIDDEVSREEFEEDGAER